jgi:outer membrane biosynthesis protein TonB
MRITLALASLAVAGMAHAAWADRAAGGGSRPELSTSEASRGEEDPTTLPVERGVTSVRSTSEASRGEEDPTALAAGRGPAPGRSTGLSLEQIRGVMRAHAAAFNACLTAATRRHKQLHGPFLYQIEVDKKGRVTSAHPYQPSSVASFDRCIINVIKRAKFPGGPARVETPLVFEAS